MHALLITGSPNLRSSTAALAAVVGGALSALSVQVRTLDLAGPVPITSTGSRHSAAELDRAVADADAVVLASPVHHAGYSGLLKAALDLLPGGSFDDKAVGLLAQGGGPRTGNVVCEQLRTVAKALGGWVVPTQVAGCATDFVTVPGGTLSPSPQLLHRCRGLADELHRCATMLAATRPAHCAVNR